MNKNAVIYATKTGHSKKLAEAIGLALNIEAKNINTKPALNHVDLLFVVGGIYGGISMPELLEYIKGLEMPLPGRAALVTSCASGSQRQTEIRSMLEKKGIEVVDEFVCRGGILFVFASHPNSKDVKDAAAFALRIVSETT